MGYIKKGDRVWLKVEMKYIASLMNCWRRFDDVSEIRIMRAKAEGFAAAVIVIESVTDINFVSDAGDYVPGLGIVVKEQKQTKQ